MPVQEQMLGRGVEERRVCPEMPPVQDSPGPFGQGALIPAP